MPSWRPRACSIAGIGSTDFSRDSGRTVLQLVGEAAVAAAADAGIALDDIDGLIRSDYDTVEHYHLADALGLSRVTYWGAVGSGGSAPCAMVAQAVAAVVGGLATTVLAYRGLNGRSGRRLGRGSAVQQAADQQRVGGQGALDEFFLPYGAIAPGQMYAMMAQRHAAEYGTRREQLGAIALEVRRRANANPGAQMYQRTMTLEDYLAAPMISEPLGLYDYCLESDGACAVLVTSSERARDLRSVPAEIVATAQGMGPDIQGGKFMPTLMRPSFTTLPSAHAAKTLYGRAGLGPADIDVAQIYDCFTISVLIQLEDYGFCPKGEGGPFAASGALAMDGELPINTSGGHLSEAYIHGMNHVVEGVRQIRGESTSQVPDAEICLVTSGVPAATSAMILGRAS
jgi:acetyl-CoA acetyltransferase